jgi:DNA-binding PadR family transcriptional regulator
MSEALPLKPREFAILLALTGGARLGYAIMQALRLDPAEPLPIGPATLYRTLKEMAEQGLITVSKGPMDSSGPPRQYYAITAAGTRAGTQEAARLASLATRWTSATS